MAYFNQFKSINDMLRAFPTEQSCIKFLEKKLWPNGVIVSPFDPTSKVYRRGDGLYRCNNTGKNFNVRKGTMFECSKLPLRTWFMAIYLITSTKKGVSSIQLAQQLGITQKSAWFLEQRIRNTFGLSQPKMLDGEVEMDETFVGGKQKNRHFNKRAPKTRGRAFVDKTPVFGMLQRGGMVRVVVVPNTKNKTLTTPILRHVDRNATIYIDDWQGYNTVKKIYKNHVIDHGHHIYAEAGGVYTNNIESFWGNYCKRPINGIYNHVAPKHLQKYFDEFAFRFNYGNVSISERFAECIVHCTKHSTWKKIVTSKMC